MWSPPRRTRLMQVAGERDEQRVQDREQCLREHVRERAQAEQECQRLLHDGTPPFRKIGICDRRNYSHRPPDRGNATSPRRDEPRPGDADQAIDNQ